MFNIKFWKTSYLKQIVAFLIPLFFILLTVHAIDNDSWFMLSEGRYLVQNGIHYTDILTMHEDMNIVVQNYGFVAIYYLIYSAFGGPGLYIAMLILNFLICLLLYKICMLLSNKNTNLSLLIMVLTDLLLSLDFVVTRAQMVSYVIMLTLIYLLELSIKTKRTKYLFFIPILSILQINLHASLWWMLLIILGFYIIDSIKAPKLHLQGYETKPLIIVGIITFLVGFINPYGFKMIAYIFTSYGNSTINQIVDEMKPLSITSSFFNATVYISVVIVILLYIFGKQRNIRIRYLLMLFSFFSLTICNIKGASQLILTLGFPLALLYKNFQLEKIIDAKRARDAILLWSGIVSICLCCAGFLIVIPSISSQPDKTLVDALDAIDASVYENQENQANQKVYVGYNNGGYVEFRGYKSYLDPRAEIFLKKNNGKKDILEEWANFVTAKIPLEEFLDTYDFDYLIADAFSDKAIYEMENPNYQLIYQDEDEEIRVFKAIK